MRKVLIIDNDIHFANTLKMYFRKQEKECVICTDGNLAVEYLNENNDIDVVLSSTQVVHKSGMELAILLKIKLQEKDIPFILITPNNNSSMNSNFSALEADAILHKPLSFQLLMSTIEGIAKMN